MERVTNISKANEKKIRQVCPRCKRDLTKPISLLGISAALTLHDKAHLREDCIAAEREVERLRAVIWVCMACAVIVLLIDWLR